ncbi:MAG: sigma-70 family RNA polymerase sigma factor [Mycobacteriales bacterium]
MSAESDRLVEYLAELDRIALLGAEQERVVVAAIEQGRAAQFALDHSGPLADEQRQMLQNLAYARIAARRRLLEAHLPLVVTLAGRYEGGSLDLLTLIQEGSLGLIRAVDKFDPAKGHRFPTYAPWWIRQALTAALRNAG